MQNAPTLRRNHRKPGIRLPRLKQNSISWLLKAALIGIVGLFVVGMLMFAWISRDLPSPGEITKRTGSSTVFVDRNDEVLFEMFEDKNRIPVKIANVPENLKHAVIAVEDKSFYTHGGFSTWGYIRSVFRIATTGRLSGGSTLTQQLVKNALLSRERTLTRKAKELILAVELERRFTKDEILEMYMNESPFGGTFWGVQSAAKGYFDKDVRELNLVESAIIAGLPQSPSVYNPISGREGAYIGRTKDVLRRMREDKYITKEEEKKALVDLENIKFKPNKLAIQAPHFVFYVRRLIAEQFGEKMLDEGITIKTTLDLKGQAKIQKITFDEIEKIKAFKATNGAVVALDSETGEILSMVGSYDYTNPEFGSYNVATARRQPGSAVKPFTYAAAFQQGYTPASMTVDASTEFPNQGTKSYTPVNYDGKFSGPVQYRFALANSLNISAVKILAQVGMRNMMQTAFDMGIKSFEPTPENIKRYGLSVTLGGGETTLLDLTNGFSTFARQGQALEPVAILEIKDNKGRSIFKHKEAKPKKVLSEEIAFLISHILSDNNARADAFGTNSFLRVPGKTVAVKTGTTNDKKDNWTVGYTNNVTVGVWVGNNDNTPMNPKIASGLTGASSIWNAVMKELFAQGYKDGIMKVPENVEAIEIDALLGGLPKDGSPSRSEYFVKGTQPTDISPFYKKVKLSKSNQDKLANDIEVKAGEYVEKDYIVLTEQDPISSDGKNRWQEGINAWVAGQGDARYKVPTETSDARNDEMVVSFKEPKDKSRVNSNEIRIRAKITSLHSIKKVEIFVGDNRVKEFNENKKDIDETIHLDDGVYTIWVKAENSDGKKKDNRVRIGVNKEWDDSGEPAPTAVPEEPTATPIVVLP